MTLYVVIARRYEERDPCDPFWNRVRALAHARGILKHFDRLQRFGAPEELVPASCVEARFTGEAAMIQVERITGGDPLLFEVIVREDLATTRHTVSMAQDACARLTAGKYPPERCLEAAFRFLLDREPKESILPRFDVTVISRYFPEFEHELPRYLSQVHPDDSS